MPNIKKVTITSGNCRRLDMASGELIDDLFIETNGTVTNAKLKAKVTHRPSQSFRKLKVGNANSSPSTGSEVEVNLGSVDDGAVRKVKYELKDQTPSDWFKVTYTVFDTNGTSQAEATITYKSTCP
ncbi:MAG: hypothetical protein IPJ76_13385 [Flavobacteriales bacterium]|nr:MAG: hypothetical protein IPJ76_13385 [Flavobacteriales bacterium]